MNKSNKLNTSWEKLSTWYTGMVGEEGSKFHQKQAIPSVVSLLEIKPSEKILEIGCGTGVLCPEVLKKSAQYFGVDASPALISQAKRLYTKGGFFIGDAVKISQIREIAGQSFDSIVFMLSIQDMDPVENIIREASKLLKANGKIVIFMTHPAFRIPRQSGWGLDEKRGLIYRRMDRYLTSEAIPLDTKTQKGFIKSTTFHRPLHVYINALIKAHLFLDKFFEIPTYKTSVDNNYSKQEKKAYEEFPLFLAIRAIKKV